MNSLYYPKYQYSLPTSPLCFSTYKHLMFKMHSGSSLHSFVNLPLRMRTSAHNQLLISSFSQPNTLLYAGHTLFPQQPCLPTLSDEDLEGGVLQIPAGLLPLL